MTTLKNHKIKNQDGFTLIELMISTAVFSVVLLIASVTIIFVSKDYSQGQIAVQTQSSAESIIQNISNAVEFNNLTTSTIQAVKAASISSAGLYYFCVGNNVYTFDLNKEYNYPSTSSSGVGLIETNSTSCSPNISGGNQLLSNNERIGRLSISPTSNNGSYAISLVIAYGSDTSQGGVLITHPIASSIPSYSYQCLSSPFSVSFCYNTTLSTIITPRIGG